MLRILGETIRTSLNHSMSYEPSPPLLAAGYTLELHALRAKEWDTKEWSYSSDIFFIGAQKKA
jgi:hypothetical protein